MYRRKLRQNLNAEFTPFVYARQPAFSQVGILQFSRIKKTMIRITPNIRR